MAAPGYNPAMASHGDLEELEGRIRALEATVETLVEVLTGRDVLTEGHKRLLGKISERKSRPEKPVVQLHVYDGDKYEVAGPDVDCAALMPICQARCCALNVKLSRQDVEEGQLEWDVEQPYILKKAADGYCQYVGDTGGCTTYASRPMECRRFDCRDDARIWIDWENKIPQPFPVVREFGE